MNFTRGRKRKKKVKRLSGSIKARRSSVAGVLPLYNTIQYFINPFLLGFSGLIYIRLKIELNISNKIIQCVITYCVTCSGRCWIVSFRKSRGRTPNPARLMEKTNIEDCKLTMTSLPSVLCFTTFFLCLTSYFMALRTH